MDNFVDAIEVAPGLEYELDNSTNQKLIKLCTARRLISELFSLNLTFMDQFFDTYPNYIPPDTLLLTLQRIYNEEEEIYTNDPNLNSSQVSLETSVGNSTDNPSSLQSMPDLTSSGSNSYDCGSIPLSRTFIINPSNNSSPDGACSLSTGTSKQKRLTTGQLTSNMSQIKKNSQRTLYEEDEFESKKPIDQNGTIVPINNFLTNHLRVLKILSNWVSKYYLDFENNKSLKQDIMNFISDIIKKENEEKKTIVYTRATMLHNSILQFEQEKMDSNNNKYFGEILKEIITQPCVNAEEINILEKTPIYAAYGFTQVSMRLQSTINIRQLLKVKWTKADRNTEADTIMRLTIFFNKITQLIKSHILCEDKASKRAKIIEFWIEVANELLTLDNYNVLSMVVGALESNVVYRLKKTWSKVSKKAKQSREKLCELMNPSSNYANLRSNYKKENYIPFIGPFLTELCYIEERNKQDIVDGRVNFKKMRLISRIISPIRKSMNYKFATPNHLKAEEDIVKFYQQSTFTDQELNERSVVLEPNEKLDN